MADVNAGNAVRFENGGKITINGKYILNIVAGTLAWKVAGYEPIPRKDRGVILPPLAGDERESEVMIDVYYTSPFDANGLAAELAGALSGNKIVNKTAAGLLYTFPIVVEEYDGLGMATGDRWTFASCYSDPVLDCKTSADADCDKMTLNCKNAEMSPTMVRF